MSNLYTIKMNMNILPKKKKKKMNMNVVQKNQTRPHRQNYNIIVAKHNNWYIS